MLSISYHINRVLRFTPGTLSNIKLREYEEEKEMASLQKKWKGLAFCLLLAVPSRFLGKMFPIIGGAVIAIIAGMVIAVFMKNKEAWRTASSLPQKKYFSGRSFFWASG